MDRYKILLNKRFSNKPGENPYFTCDNIIEEVPEEVAKMGTPKDIASAYLLGIKNQFKTARLDKVQIRIQRSFLTMKYEVIPCNLYSFLLLKGIEIPYYEIEGKDRYENSFGTFSYVNGTIGFKPKNPVEITTTSRPRLARGK